MAVVACRAHEYRQPPVAQGLHKWQQQDGQPGVVLVLWAAAVGVVGPGFFSQKDVATALAAELGAGGGIISANDLATAAPAVREPLQVQVKDDGLCWFSMHSFQWRTQCAVFVCSLGCYKLISVLRCRH